MPADFKNANGNDIGGLDGLPLNWRKGTRSELYGKTIHIIEKPYGSKIGASPISHLIDAVSFSFANRRYVNANRSQKREEAERNSSFISGISGILAFRIADATVSLSSEALL